MAQSRFFKLPQAQIPQFDEQAIETDPLAPVASPVVSSQVASTPDSPDQMALKEYMRRWQAGQDAEAPDTSGYQERSADRGMLQGISEGAGLLANIKGEPDPYNMSTQLKAQEAQDKAQMGADMNSFSLAKTRADEALKQIPGLQEKIDMNPLKVQEKQLALRTGEQKLSDLDAAEADRTEKSDPGSSISVAYRQLAKKLAPSLQITDRTSAASLEKLLPTMKDIFNAEQARVAKATAAAKPQWTKPYVVRVQRPDGTWEEHRKVKNLATEEEMDLGIGGLTDEQKLAAKVTSKEANAEEDARAALNKMESMEQQANSLRKQATMTGPVAGRISGALSSVGYSIDDKATELDAMLTRELSNYIKQYAGVAVSPEEKTRLQKVTPLLTDSGALFAQKMKALKTEATMIVNEKRAERGLAPLDLTSGKAPAMVGETSDPVTTKDTVSGKPAGPAIGTKRTTKSGQTVTWDGQGWAK